jgi:hypothetical protein
MDRSIGEWGGRKRMTVVQILGVLVLAVVIVLALYLVLLRPWSRRRGATDAEVGRSLPGDDLVPRPKTEYTQAITINAPPEGVWPWLIQIGYQRAGWYTYDWFYRLTGSADFHDGTHSAERIIPELQDLKVGDTIELAAGMSFEVAALEPYQALVLLARVDMDTGQPFELTDVMPAKYLNISWAYLLEGIDANSSRLIVRWHGDTSAGLGNALVINVPTEAGALIMQPKLLKGIKARAEASDGQQGGASGAVSRPAA